MAYTNDNYYPSVEMVSAASSPIPGQITIKDSKLQAGNYLGEWEEIAGGGGQTENAEYSRYKLELKCQCGYKSHSYIKQNDYSICPRCGNMKLDMERVVEIILNSKNPDE